MAHSQPTDKNPLGVNIEEPGVLIYRMSLPTSWDEQVLSSCDIHNASNLASQLTKIIKLSIPKGVANVAELKVTRSSPEVAKACANSVFEAIAKSQTQMIELFAQQTKASSSARVKIIEERLAQDKNLLAKAQEPKNGISPTYFALLSEVRNLEDERERLLIAMSASNVQSATLQSPIYVADKPIYPKKR